MPIAVIDLFKSIKVYNDQSKICFIAAGSFYFHIKIPKKIPLIIQACQTVRNSCSLSLFKTPGIFNSYGSMIRYRYKNIFVFYGKNRPVTLIVYINNTYGIIIKNKRNAD